MLSAINSPVAILVNPPSGQYLSMPPPTIPSQFHPMPLSIQSQCCLLVFCLSRSQTYYPITYINRSKRHPSYSFPYPPIPLPIPIPIHSYTNMYRYPYIPNFISFHICHIPLNQYLIPHAHTHTRTHAPMHAQYTSHHG